MANVSIAPSILASDFTMIKENLDMLERAGADWVHIDVMDGVFVPNITIGPQFVENIKARTKLPLDVHLMIDRPQYFAPIFAQAGADRVTVHVEGHTHLNKTLNAIKKEGARAGIALNPHSGAEQLRYVLDDIDYILVMSVNPGFGGQSFIDTSLDKIADTKRMIDNSGRDIRLAVDGGVNEENSSDIVYAGADFLVAGSAVFKSKDPKETILKLRG